MDPAKLDSYRSRLVSLRDRMHTEATNVAESVATAGNSAGDVSDLPTHFADRATEGLDRDLAVLATEEQLLAQTSAALARIDAGTYGTCQSCGREIPVTRLDALPFTPFCVECSGLADEERGG